MKNRMVMLLMLLSVVGCIFAQSQEGAADYIQRAGNYMGMAARTHVEVNGEYVGSLKNSEEMKVLVPEGQVDIKLYMSMLSYAKAKNNSLTAIGETSFTAKNNEEHFFKFGVRAGWIKNTLKINHLSADAKGDQKKIAEIRRKLANVQLQDISALAALAKNGERQAMKQQAENILAAQKAESNVPAQDMAANTSQAAVPMPQSDVDKGIPQVEAENVNTFAVIIAEENYIREAKVPYAMNDGKMFKEYCLRTLGMPESNVKYVENATLNDIKFHLGWLKNVLEAYDGEAKAIFYYAGHGVPDEVNKTASLLPVDGYGSDVSTGYSLKNLYAMLSEAPSAGVAVFLDACFSGTKREGDMIASARGIAIKVKEEVPQGNMVVLSASQSDETAYPYKEKAHGLFTYFLLKKLQETKGEATLGELSEYINKNVSRQSVVANGKPQTPSTIASEGAISWHSWKLK